MLTEKLKWSDCAGSDRGHLLHNPETQGVHCFLHKEEGLDSLSGRSLQGEVSGCKWLGGGSHH